jgi:FixJ family two-component response regulator
LSDETLISIVDDDRSVRDSLRRLLKSFGFAVKIFPSAVEFLASAHIGETDCLIADINMPETASPRVPNAHSFLGTRLGQPPTHSGHSASLLNGASVLSTEV